MEQLAVPQRLGQSVGEVQPRHLLVPDLGVEPHELGVLQLRDEGQGVADGREQDVAAGLVGLGLEREPQRSSPAPGRRRTAGRGTRRTGRAPPARSCWRRARRPRGRPTSRRSRRRSGPPGRCCGPPSPGRVGGPRGCWRSAPPSLNTGSPNRLVVTISTRSPVSASAFSRRSSVASRVPSSGTTSSSWNVTAAAPSPASWCTASIGSSSGRVAGPNTSTACHPTVQRPKENLSSGGRGEVVHRGTSCQLRVSELVSIAASTRCTWRPSANVGSRLGAVGDRLDQVDHLVGEGVLVAEPVAGWPPGADIGMGRLGDEDPPEAGGLVGLLGVVQLQHVHVLEVERQAAARSR